MSLQSIEHEVNTLFFAMGVLCTSFIDILSCIFANIDRYYLLFVGACQQCQMNFLHVNESSDIFISDFTLYFD